MATRRRRKPPTPQRWTSPACLAMGVVLIWVTPLRAQEAAEGTAATTVGPVGMPIGGGSLADPAERFGSSPDAPPVRLGAFGATFAGAAAPEGPPRAWTVTPGIGLAVGATNNVYQTAHDARSDVFLDITPSILVDGNTARVRATISYAPSARLYATYTDQNTFPQLGSGQILAELVPDRLFLDIRGYANIGTATGGYAPGTAQSAQRDNQVQYYNFMASPYYVHRFGSFATAQIGYVFQSYTQTGTTQFTPGSTEPFFNDQDFIANRGYAVVRTGEDFGRLALQGRVDGTAFTGSGVYDGAHVFVSSVEARYAILPTVAVLVEGGYENIDYGGTDPEHISDAIWSVGARLTPTPNSFLVVRYGHRGGFTSPSLQAGIQLGAYTRLTVGYAEQLSTTGTLGQDLLASTTLDRLGNPVDAQSGAPVLYANPFFSSTSGLYRNKIGSAALSIAWPRDSVSFYGYYLEQDPVSAAPGTQISKSTSYFGGIAWTHELTPETSIMARAEYGRTEYGSGPSTETDVFFGSAGLYHRFTPRLSGLLQVFYTNQTSNQADGGYGQATVLVGINRSF